ncbi:MAG: PPOX class F420-dependent oxidoreductase [Jatrophihabitans sp.]
MTTELPQQAKDLLDASSFVVLATVNEDGSPQTSVLWASRDGDTVLLSTVRGRKKERNLTRDPRASLLILDAANPYSYAEVRGSVTLSEEGGDKLINDLSLAYNGAEYTGDDGTGNVRVVVRLTPEHVVAAG